MQDNRYYKLDHQDRICETGGNWDQFALENNGPGAVGSQVYGSSIWDAIKSFEVQSYLNALFFSARQKNSVVSLLYRCDSFYEPRLFMMRIIPTEGQGLIVEHQSRFIAIEEPKGSLVSLVSRHSDVKCASCCSIRIDGEWVDPFVQPLEGDFPKGLGLCKKCKEKAISVLSKVPDRDLNDNVLSLSASQLRLQRLISC
ncbi:MAG: hypothetical protein ABJL67_00285 [Sulfitobacter sp.]